MRLVAALLLLFPFMGRAQSPPASNEARLVCGWTVHVSSKLREQLPQATERALELLGAQLEEIVRVVPGPAVVDLQKVPLYFNPEYTGVQPRAEYHPGAGWLKEHGRDPVMAKGVEFTNIRIFEAETRRMPNFALHELAHAYHDRVLPGGYAHAGLKAAYERARASGKYDRVERSFGDSRAKAFEKAYAMTNPQEYFAETTEAYFSRNDFFPFTREQLIQHDGEMAALVGQLWKTPRAP